MEEKYQRLLEGSKPKENQAFARYRNGTSFVNLGNSQINFINSTKFKNLTIKFYI